ncbi:class I SAM-dependent methyltransferase [Halobacterium zhouii]|uniref:class I SAM-dependent methyltransferase n=1 Tax=Halobacterium zhouii TaxID=2902624 RepID=UPI001E557628|nr:class I SAM-dependent methyltransferase [Halobacterium zhouii]
MDTRELLLFRAARETGILDALVSDADTPAEVADSAGVTERAARLTVDALCDMGFLERVDDGVEPTNRMLGFITKTDVRSIGSLPHELDQLDALLALPETMESGDPPLLNADWTRNWLGARAAEDDASVRAAVTAAVRVCPDADDVLVLADGPGQHAVEFARRGFDVTLLDDPEVVDAIDPLLEHERVSLVAADPLDGVGESGEFDLVVYPRVAREYGPEDNRQLLSSARDALREDGMAVHLDAFRNGDPDAALAAEVLARTKAGDCYREETVGGWFSDTGFADVRAGDVPGTDLRFVAGRRRSIQ